jgi:hypothetical protein
MNQKLKPKPVDPGSKAYREDEGGLHTMKTRDRFSGLNNRLPTACPRLPTARPSLFLFPPELFPRLHFTPHFAKVFFRF